MIWTKGKTTRVPCRDTMVGYTIKTAVATTITGSRTRDNETSSCLPLQIWKPRAGIFPQPWQSRETAFETENVVWFRENGKGESEMLFDSTHSIDGRGSHRIDSVTKVVTQQGLIG